MRNAITIARKELSVYFSTVVGYSGFGAFAFVMGLVFISALNKYQQYTLFYLKQQNPQGLEQLNFHDGIIMPMLSTGLWLFLFFVPFLTMRLFAEEKSARTFELLMTAPITSFQMVMGKFLSVTIMIATLTALPLIFPLLIDFYASSPVEWSPVWSGCLSILLMGLTFCSIGIFISALAESQIVAALLTFAALLLCFVLPLIAGRLDGDWRAVIEYITPITHVTSGLQGRLRLNDLIYFGTVITTFLFLAQRAVESLRWRG